jgi:uncharacterized protein
MKIFYTLLTGLTLFALPSYAESLQIETTKQTLVFDVEIADTQEERRIGLMNRESLPNNGGMLFIFEEVIFAQFWMKDTKIPLDILYIGEDGIIKGIHANALPNDETPIPPPAPALAVLEIAGGSAESLGIVAGNKVIHKIFEKDLK